MAIGTIGAAVLGGLGSAAIGASASRSAARSQERAARDELALQERIYEEGLERFEPYQQAGATGMQAYLSELGLGEAPEGYGGIQVSPAYQFMLDQGLEDIQASAAARGGLYSGATGTALERYRMGLASQEANNYLNRLAGLSSQGQAAAGMQQGAGQYFAQGAGQALQGIGQAQASRAVGTANAITGGINQGLGLYGYLQGGGTGFGGGGM